MTKSCRVKSSFHSGEFVGDCALTDLCRVYRVGSEHRVGQVTVNSISDADQRKLHFHVFGQRGYLLFGRMWLLVGGEMEFHVLPQISKMIGEPFSALGIYVIQFAQFSIDLLINLADQIGIRWYILSEIQTTCDAEGRLNSEIETDDVG